jgi:hypothetical protein
MPIRIVLFPYANRVMTRKPAVSKCILRDAVTATFSSMVLLLPMIFILLAMTAAQRPVMRSIISG